MDDYDDIMIYFKQFIQDEFYEEDVYIYLFIIS